MTRNWNSAGPFPAPSSSSPCLLSCFSCPNSLRGAQSDENPADDHNPPVCLRLDRTCAGRFTVVGSKGVYLTEDGGQSWWFYDCFRKVPGLGLNNIAAVNGETILLSSGESGVFRRVIRRLADGSLEGAELIK